MAFHGSLPVAAYLQAMLLTHLTHFTTTFWSPFLAAGGRFRKAVLTCTVDDFYTLDLAS